MKKTTIDWLKSAENDLKTIEKIIDDDNLTPVSAFHAQQAIEKSFKAIIEEFDFSFIRTHDLELLYHNIEEKIGFNINLELLQIMGEIYISSRYPSDLGLMPYGNPTQKDVIKFFKFAENIYTKIFLLLEQNK